MNRRTWAILISLVFALACIFGSGCLLFYFGVTFDRGLFSSESLAQLSIAFQGGTRFVLEAEAAEGVAIPTQDMDAEKTILQARLSALGTKAVVRIQDERHLVVDVAGNMTQSQVAAQLSSGLLEFIDADSTPLQEGQIVQTTVLPTADVPGQPSPTLSSGTPPVYRTVMTGKDVRSASVGFDQNTNQPYVQFTLTDNGTKIFADFTTKNVGKYLAIAVDKKVISSPIINSAITQGDGIIQGHFTQEQVEQLVVQLRYGALLFPLKIVEATSISK